MGCGASSQGPAEPHDNANPQQRGKRPQEEEHAKEPLAPPSRTRAAVALLLPAPRPATAVTQRGVTLGFLLQLLEQGAVDAGWTVQQMVERFVMPHTAGKGCCLYDLVPETHAGPPHFFISYTWSLTLCDLTGLIKEHLGVKDSADDPGAKQLIWLDVFAVCQHPEARGQPSAELSLSDVAKVIQVTERTLLLMDAQCVTLTRAWCLYEVWQTVLAKGAGGLLVLCMPTLDAAQLTKALGTLDVAKAKATLPADHDRILEEVQGSVGHVQFNLDLRRALVDSARLETEHCDATRLPKALKRAADFASGNGEHDQALPLYQRVLEHNEQAHGAAHPDSLESLLGLAQCLADMMRQDEALPMYRRGLAGREQALGAAHADTLATVNDLGICVYYLGQNDEALALFQSALAGREQLLGGKHPKTLDTICNVAICLTAMGRKKEALLFWHRAVEVSEHVNGYMHPDTANPIAHLASCLQDLWRFNEAAPLCRKALDIREKALGPSHPDVLACVVSLASCLQAMGRYTEALVLSQRAVSDSEQVLGGMHANTLAAVHNLGSCLGDMGRYEEALPWYLQAVEGRKQGLGDAHPDTLISVSYLAHCQEKIERAHPRVAPTDHQDDNDVD